MKKLFVFLFVLVLVGLSQAQWVVDSYNYGVGPVAGAVGPKWAETAVLNTNFYAEGTSPQMNLSNSSDA
jgi:hypothetical protein